MPKEPNPWAGLDYLPRGKHWCSVFMQGRVLGGFCIYALKDPKGPWKDAAAKLVDGLKKITIIEDDVAYPFLNCTEPGKEVIKPKKRPTGIRGAING
jgi:hypothetical protein